MLDSGNGFFIQGHGVSKKWVNDQLVKYQPKVNDIGIAGAINFGVGICPASALAPGFIAESYGNYRFSDGSVMVYIPKCYIKIGTGANGLAVNVIDVKAADYFANTTTANASGYFLPAAFINGGVEQLGFFYDKYDCSKNANGTGFVASSIKDGLPLSTTSTHNPMSEVTASLSVNACYACIDIAKGRDGVNGVKNPTSKFFVSTRAMQAVIAMLSMAHGQVSTNTTACAWYDATGVKNYPKGCNDNALKDYDDQTVTYISDGFPNCGKTGSGMPFAKTTHNGQNSGIADVNGLGYNIGLGVTCIAVTKVITAITKANPCALTVTGHGQVTGSYVDVSGIVGTTELNDKIYTITVVDINTVTLDGVDATNFTTYASEGTARFGTFYRAKPSIKMEDFTSGTTLATDHWGATGVAAMMEPFVPAFQSTYLTNGYSQGVGLNANQVLSETLTGNLSVLTGLGLPQNSSAISTEGTNLFGKDYFYQKINDSLCLLSGGTWYNTSSAGVWYSNWLISRTSSNASVLVRCACYPV